MSYLAILAAIVIFILFMMFLYYFPFGLWMSARFAGVPLGIFSLVRMRFMRVPPAVIVQNLITAVKAGVPVSTDLLIAHYLAGGHVDVVVQSLIAAQRAQVPLDWGQAAAIDLAGRNPQEALAAYVTPKVIETPIFQGVAKDGIQLNVKARITVRTKVERIVGGAGEATIVARVGEGVVAAVGSSLDYKEVLENPDHISKTVLSKGLDAGTGFEIVSIDIADVDVGRNVGADLQTAQAEADRRVAQAKAAERQYAALAQEQEMKAQTQAMRAKVVEAEALVPTAMAEAFRAGNLGVMDYYRMKNVLADTEMRQTIAGQPSGGQPSGGGPASPPAGPSTS
ncbi:MAG TPA: flotillin-like protein FloA [Candidatus Eremiobacteraceae bacterium]|nr:flotillin-like protein FloA [Candidatus Eremiobacteraceae bacterium]